MTDIEKAYKEDELFKEYVDAFATSTNKTTRDALECATVREVFEFYKSRKK